MEIGKIPTQLLEKIIITPVCQNNPKRKEVLIQPSVGEDCTAIDFENEICVLSTDPITGASKEIGKIAVNINANDIASSGAEPIGLMITILLPPSSSETELHEIMQSIYQNANKSSIAILGGHTEVTDAVNKPIVSCTVIGKTKNRKFISSGGAKVGDKVIMTKVVGLEGTAIIVNDFEDRLKGHISNDKIKRAKALSDNLSVIQEGKIAVEVGVNCMHDVTEGGILGACYEIAKCSNKGIIIDIDKMPITDETKEICAFFNIDPYRLISSGCMLMTSDKADVLVQKLEQNGIKATIIGEITENGYFTIKNGKKEELNEPDVDELYKVK